MWRNIVFTYLATVCTCSQVPGSYPPQYPPQKANPINQQSVAPNPTGNDDSYKNYGNYPPPGFFPPTHPPRKDGILGR